MRPVAVFDLDGTLADVHHRVHHVEGSPKRWGAFFAEAVDDPPLDTGVALLREAARDCDIAYVTGRPEHCRADTVAWLARHDLPVGALHMRPLRDHRPGRQAKLELLRGLAAERVVAVVVDDDPQVCDAYEQAGFAVLRATWAAGSAALRRAQEVEGRT